MYLDLKMTLYYSQTNFDIANVVHSIYKDKFVCSCIKQNKWYELIDSEWVQCESAYSLYINLSTEVAKEYCKFASKMSEKASAEDDAYTREKYTEQAKKAFEISLKLKNNTKTQ